MKKTKNEEGERFVGGVFFQKKSTEPNETLSEKLNLALKKAELPEFRWRVNELKDGVVFLIGDTGTNFSMETFDLVKAACSHVLTPEEMLTFRAITLMEEARKVLLKRDFDPGDSWYWPLDVRLNIDQDLPAIRMAHMDTGITNHPSLEGAFYPELTMDFFRDQSEREGNGIIPLDKIFKGELIKNFRDHGTATAGLIIAHPSFDIKIFGMIPLDCVEMISCRVSNSVILDTNDLNRLADAIEWSVDNGCKVITISLGSQGFENQKLKESITYAFNNGVIVCCAAGQLVPFMLYPAVFSLEELCICCGASTPNNEPWSSVWWNTYDDGYVTIGAPGTNMPKIYWSGKNEETAVASIMESEGSSYSTAFTASVAALWYRKHQAILKEIDPSVIVPLFKRIIQATCFEWGKQNGYSIEKIGPGILDPNAVLEANLEEYL